MTNTYKPQPDTVHENENSAKLVDIRPLIEDRIKAEEAALQAAVKLKDDPVTLAFVKECFFAGDSYEGTLFAELNRNRLRLNKNSGQWLRWAGHYWEIDLFDKRYADIELVIGKYFALIAEANDEDLKRKISKRIKKLRSKNGAEDLLTWAGRGEKGLGVRGEEFDCNPWAVACKNGVIELKTGRFRQGRPEDNLTKAVPHEWIDIDHPAPTWERFLNEVFEGNRELIAFIQRLFGYGLTGLVTAHAFVILYGEGGRNGKGTLVETFQHILSPLAGPIQPEMLLEQKGVRSSSAPTPDIMSLKGLRLAFASETDENRRFSASKIKWFSGGDTLNGRNPHDRYETKFTPSHLLCLLTNHLPHAPADDLAFWDRMLVIPFNVRFVLAPKAPNERPRQEGLVEKLKAEAPGILAWLVRGCLEWQRQGLNPPPSVRAATAQYQFREDNLGNFLAECCELTESDGTRTAFKDLYEAFEAWFLVNYGGTAPRKKKFSGLMERRFRREKVGGIIYFYGIALIKAGS